MMKNTFKFLGILILLSTLFISCNQRGFDGDIYDTHNDAVNKLNMKIQIDSVFNVNDWQYDSGYRLDLKFMSKKIIKYELWHRDNVRFSEKFTVSYFISINANDKRINSVWIR